MARHKNPTQVTKGSRPFITPEGQENHLISLAYNLVEERLRNGTASSQEVTEFLKRGSKKETLEREKLEEENKLLRAKTEALQSQKNIDELYKEAISAMRKYSGQSDGDPDENF